MHHEYGNGDFLFGRAFLDDIVVETNADNIGIIDLVFPERSAVHGRIHSVGNGREFFGGICVGVLDRPAVQDIEERFRPHGDLRFWQYGFYRIINCVLFVRGKQIILFRHEIDYFHAQITEFLFRQNLVLFLCPVVVVEVYFAHKFGSDVLQELEHHFVQSQDARRNLIDFEIDQTEVLFQKSVYEF